MDDFWCEEYPIENYVKRKIGILHSTNCQTSFSSDMCAMAFESDLHRTDSSFYDESSDSHFDNSCESESGSEIAKNLDFDLSSENSRVFKFKTKNHRRTRRKSLKESHKKRTLLKEVIDGNRKSLSTLTSGFNISQSPQGESTATLNLCRKILYRRFVRLREKTRVVKNKDLMIRQKFIALRKKRERLISDLEENNDNASSPVFKLRMSEQTGLSPCKVAEEKAKPDVICRSWTSPVFELEKLGFEVSSSELFASENLHRRCRRNLEHAWSIMLPPDDGC